MPHLALSVLGPLTATLDGRPLAGLESNKVRALLVYLALEAGHPHLRTLLASLLWPNHDDTAALANLRYALANLRAELGDRAPDQTPFLLVTRATLEFNCASSHWVDAMRFLSLTQDIPPGGLPDLARLEEAIGLYRGRKRALHCGHRVSARRAGGLPAPGRRAPASRRATAPGRGVLSAGNCHGAVHAGQAVGAARHCQPMPALAAVGRGRCRLSPAGAGLSLVR